MGLLNQAAPEQAAPQMGGLLGQSAAPQGGDIAQAKQMAMMLSQSTTPETAQKIIQELTEHPSEGAQQLVQALTQGIENPESLQKIAAMMIQRIGAM